MDDNWRLVLMAAAAAAPGVVAAWHGREVRKEVKEVRKDMNGKLAELIESKSSLAAAEAVVGEKQAQQDRQDSHSADERKRV